MFNKAGMGDLMKKAEEMQENMQKMQAEIANTEVVGESGAGLVKVTILGNHHVRKVAIDESLMEDDKEMLELQPFGGMDTHDVDALALDLVLIAL